MKNLLLLTGLLLSLSIYANDIEWSDLIPAGRRTAAPTIIGQDGENIYLLRYSKTKTYIDKYDIDKLSLKLSTQLVLKYKDKKLTLLGQFMFGKQPILLSSFYNKKTKKYYFFLQKIDKRTLKLSTPKPVGSFFIKKSGGLIYTTAATNENPRDRSFYISPDGKHGYFLSVKNTEKKLDSKLSIGLLINSSFEEEAKSEVQMPFTNEEFVTLKSELADNGLFYILGYNQIQGKSGNLIKRQAVFRDDIWLIVIDPESGETDKVKVETEKDISMLSFTVSSNDDIIVSGLTSEDNTGVTGSFSIMYDAGLEEINHEYVRFEDDFITSSWSDKAKQKHEKKKSKAQKKGKQVNEPKLYNYYIDHILENNDGSFTVLAEQYYVVVRTTTTTNANGSMTTTTTYYYYYNDIIAVNYSKKGEFNWKTLIDKYQVSVNDGGFYSSYFPINDDGQLSLIFNQREIDLLDNKDDLSSREKKTAARKTMGVKVDIDSDGEQDKTVLFSFDEDEGFKLAPKYCSYIGDDLVFLYARNRKGNKLGTLTIN